MLDFNNGALDTMLLHLAAVEVFLSFFPMEEQRPFGSISSHTVFTEELVYLRMRYMRACCFQKSCFSALTRFEWMPLCF